MRRRLLLAAALVVVVAVGLMTYQAVRTALALRAAQDDASRVAAQVRDGDVTGARQAARRLEADSRTAKDHSDTILWNAASHLPWVGQDVEAVQVVARAIDDVSRSAVPQALTLYSSVQGGQALRSSDGRFDLEAIGALSPGFDAVARELKAPSAALSGLDAQGLISPLRGPVGQAQLRLASLDRVTRGAATASRLLPPLLGGDGPRSYLLVVQNNAEIRATGGLPGALALLEARNGKVTLGKQFATPDFMVQKRPFLPITSGERSVYGGGFGRDLRGLNATPDFPRAAALFRAAVARTQGVSVDGVLAVDPVTLSAVMRATGPITFGGERLTADNVVPTLLNRTYQRFAEPPQQDAYFSAAARAVFAALVSGRGSPSAVLKQVSGAVDQQRVLFWSRYPALEAQLDGTAVSGRLPRDSGRDPKVGIYLNDSTAGKMEYYLRYRGDLVSRACTDAGRQQLRANVTLRSRAPEDVSTLAPYITAFGQFAPKGSIRLNLRAYAPVGGEIVSVSANGRRLDVDRLQHDGHQVVVVGLLLDPGGAIRIQVDLRTRAGQSGDPELEMTPGIEPRMYSSTAPSSCG